MSKTEWLHATGVAICSSVTPNCKNAIFSKTKQFRAVVSIDRKSYRRFSKNPFLDP